MILQEKLLIFLSPALIDLALFLGLLTLLNILYKLSIWIFSELFLYRKNLLQRYGQKSFAVITGCTEGIGKSYAQELARDNFNLILISRNQQKLENLKVDLLKDFGPREIILIKADFTKSYESDFYDKIANQISPFDISILVNNIGVANFSQFHEEQDQILRDMIYTNIFPQVFMSKIILPKLLQRKNRSAIINLSSQAGKFIAPYISLYSATKAFGTFFSQALTEEFSSKIDVLSVTPGAVESYGTQKLHLPNLITAEQCVRASLNKLPATYQTDGHFRHCLNALIVSILPYYLQVKIFKTINKSIMKDQKNKQN